MHPMIQATLPAAYGVHERNGTAFQDNRSVGVVDSYLCSLINNIPIRGCSRFGRQRSSNLIPLSRAHNKAPSENCAGSNEWGWTSLLIVTITEQASCGKPNGFRSQTFVLLQ